MSKILKTGGNKVEIGYADRFGDAAGDITVMVAEMMMNSLERLPPEGQAQVKLFVETKLTDVIFKTLESTPGLRSTDGLKWMENNKESLAKSMYSRITGQ